MSLYDDGNPQHLEYRDFWRKRGAEYDALPKWTVTMHGEDSKRRYQVRAVDERAARKLAVACSEGFAHYGATITAGWESEDI